MVRPKRKMLEDKNYSSLFVTIANKTSGKTIPLDMRIKDYHKNPEIIWEDGITTREIKQNVSAINDVLKKSKVIPLLWDNPIDARTEPYTNRLNRMKREGIIEIEPILKNIPKKHRWVIKKEFVITQVFERLMENPYNKNVNASSFKKPKGRDCPNEQISIDQFHNLIYGEFIGYIKQNLSFLNESLSFKMIPNKSHLQWCTSFFNSSIKKMFENFLIYFQRKVLLEKFRGSYDKIYIYSDLDVISNIAFLEFIEELDYYCMCRVQNPYV